MPQNLPNFLRNKNSVDFSKNFNNKIIVLDTNVYSRLFDLSVPSSSALKKVIESIKDHIIVPSKVKEEYLAFNQREKNGNHNTLITNLKKMLQEQEKDFFQKVNSLKNLEFTNLNKFEKDMKKLFSDMQNRLQKYDDSLKTEKQIRSPYIETLIELIDTIIKEKSLDDPDILTLLKLVKEGDIRLTYGIPPGHKDTSKKEPIKQLGDFIIWKEIINHAKDSTETKDYVFITNDTKEWTAEGVDKRLLQEFNSLTNKEIEIMTMKEFFVNFSSIADEIPIELVLFEVDCNNLYKRLETLISKKKSIVSNIIEEHKDSIIEEIKGSSISPVQEFFIPFALSKNEYKVTSVFLSEKEFNKDNNTATYQWDTVATIEIDFTSMFEDLKPYAKGSFQIRWHSTLEREIGTPDSPFIEKMNQCIFNLHFYITSTSLSWGGNYQLANEIAEQALLNEPPYKYTDIECSNCGERIPDSKYTTDEYCPNCIKKYTT